MAVNNNLENDFMFIRPVEQRRTILEINRVVQVNQRILGWGEWGKFNSHHVRIISQWQLVAKCGGVCLAVRAVRPMNPHGVFRL